MKIRNAVAAGLIAASASFGVATATAAETTPASETTAVEAPATGTTTGTETGTTTGTESGSSFGDGSSTIGNTGSSDKLDALSSEVDFKDITGVINTLGSLAQSIIGLVTAIVG